MIRDRSGPSWPVVAVLVAALAGCAAAAAGVGAAQAEPAVVVTDATADAGENATVRVVLTAAPDGLAGYEARLALDGDARIVGAEYPDRFGLTSAPEVGPDGRTVRLEAADLGDRVGPGAANVTLATVTVAGTGSTTVAVTDLRADADGGARLAPATESGRLTVAGERSSPQTSSATAGSRTPSSGSATPATASDGDPAAGAARGRNSPGFGVPAAAAAAVVAALLARRR